MFTAIMLATTGFCVLTGATTASRLQAVGFIEENYRSAYDILVRPAGSRGELESQQGLLRPNFLSGQFGGLSLDQWRAIQEINGVEVAAPVAMVGYVTVDLDLTVDLTDHVDRSAERQLLRLSPETVADRGLTQVPGTPAFVYVTRNRLIRVRSYDNGRLMQVYDDGTELSYHDVARRCGLGNVAAPLEVLADGRKELVCNELRDAAIGPLVHIVQAYELKPDGTFRNAFGSGQSATERLTVRLPAVYSMLIAAVDPDQEARLSGLDRAVTSGRYLRTDELPQPTGGEHSVPAVPLLATDRLATDERMRVAVSALREPERVRATESRPDLAPLLREPGAPRPGEERELTSIWADWMTTTTEGGVGEVWVHDLLTVASPSYQQSGNALRVESTEAPAPERLRTPAGIERFSPLALDTALRKIGPDSRENLGVVVAGTLVGTVNPEAVMRGRELTGAPMETFVPPQLAGADQRSADALGGKQLLPNSSITGYVAEPPQLFTNLAALPDLLQGVDVRQAEMPLSAVRVRVAGIERFDAAARERVRAVAEEIATRTGLDVDIVLGSSGAKQTLILPAGEFGRPQLTVDELWTKKGVAAVIVQAVDAKSMVLLGMVLIACILFVGNAVSAAVRDRRRELAILACHGWPARRLAALILGEAGLLGALAGAAAAMLTMPIARAVGISVPWSRVALAFGVAVLLALAAALVPALRAARSYPAAAVHPATATSRGRPGAQRTLWRMAVTGARRVPGRTALAALSLAIAVAAMTFAFCVEIAFQGRIVGTVLGDGVSVTIRDIDRFTIAGLLFFSVAAVADVLYLGVRERASEFAALSAMGWSDAAAGRLVSLEGLTIGVLGGVTGAAAALVGVWFFAGGLTSAAIVVAAAATIAGLLLAAAGGVLPAAMVRRMPASQLAE
ncbi:MAG TPA: ABC transporter permease [Micromonosporaceae bacterium]|nr:ABC transporter permease [Micromonosporaceae bacterium]